MEDINDLSNYRPYGDRVSSIYETLEMTKEKGNSERREESAPSQRNRPKHKTSVCIGITATVISALCIALAITIYMYLSSHKEGKLQETNQCSKHVPVENGNIFNTTGTSYGDFFEIKCNRGSKLVGHGFVTCLSSGKWSNTPKCVPKNCSDLKVPSNMELDSEILSTGVVTEIALNCKDGFVTANNRTMICKEDETWSDISLCTPVDCEVPLNIPNAKLKGLQTTTYNSTFYVQCNAGYNIRGSEFVRCNENGKWDDMPYCEEVTCGLPPIPVNGSISQITGTSFRANVSLKCDEGFFLTGTSDITCLANGSWTSGPSCTRLNTFNECSSNPCNNGTCTDFVDYYNCSCFEGYSGLNCQKVLTDCYDIYHYDGKRKDGVYTIVTWKTKQHTKVYCDMTTDGGGWTVFQYRFNRSVDFDRNLSEYEQGFGNLNSDFWLGLSYIQEIASQRQMYLRIDLEAFNGTKAFEQFEQFYLSEGPDYTLHLGSTTYSLRISSSSSYSFGSYHDGSKFSTYDHDVDSASGNCAIQYRGGWWYTSCFKANLNGNVMYYHTFIFNGHLKSSKMMIKS